MVCVHLLIYDELDVPHLVFSSNFWEQAADSKRHILLLKSIRFSMGRVHAAEVDNVLYHLVNHIGENVDDLILENVGSTTSIGAHFLETLLVEDIVILLSSVN